MATCYSCGKTLAPGEGIRHEVRTGRVERRRKGRTATSVTYGKRLFCEKCVFIVQHPISWLLLQPLRLAWWLVKLFFRALFWLVALPFRRLKERKKREQLPPKPNHHKPQGQKRSTDLGDFMA